MTESSSLVVLSERERVVTLVLNRPGSRNALSTELCGAVTAAMETADRSADARVVVMRGAGKAFCSGADFAEVAAESGRSAAVFLPAFEEMLEAVGRHRLPTIAAVHGAALGGGLQLAMACDFRVATAAARIGIPSSRLGILVNFENVQRLVIHSGVAVAKDVLLRAKMYSGEDAAAAGLVTTSVSDDALEKETYGIADELAGLAPRSVQGSKRAIQLVVDHLSAARATAPDAVAEMDRLVADAYASRDLREGLRAKTEKRAPEFTGE